MSLPVFSIYFNIFSFMLLLFFNIEMLYIPQDFQFYKEIAAVLGRAMSKSSRSQTQWNFDQILNLSDLLHAFNPLEFRQEFNLGDILFTFLMYLLFEMCITRLILVSVLHSCTLCLSLLLVYHFVWSVLLLSAVIFIDIFNHSQ